MTPSINVGAQGWNYAAWVGPFYPLGTRPNDFLHVYSRAFDTVEVDSTFYAIPAASTVRGWAARVPADFVFALKMPQEITHVCRLRRCQSVLHEFVDRARELGDKLGAVLIQLGPDFTIDELPALTAFLAELPREVRFAVEFRHRAWINDHVIALLQEYGVALALTDARWIARRQMLELAMRPTADFAYLRWMGANRDIVDYSQVQIDRSREIAEWVDVLPALLTRVKTVYAYVNNHFAGHSPATVRDLQRGLGLPVTDPSTLGEQLSFL